MTLAHEIVGPATAPALVFLHGWTSNRQTFTAQHAALSKGWRCLFVDLPGHGESPPPTGDCSVGWYAAAVAEFLSAHDLAHAIPIGHSLGGLIALELAARPDARHPAVVLIDPAPIVKTPAMQASLERTQAMIAARGRLAAQGVLADKVFFLDSDPADVRREVIASSKATTDAVAIPTWDGIVAYDGRPALQRCAAPLLFVNAATPQNREDDIRVHAAGPVHWGRTVGAGHFNHRIAPAQVNAMIADFLRLAATG